MVGRPQRRHGAQPAHRRRAGRAQPAHRGARAARPAASGGARSGSSRSSPWPARAGGVPALRAVPLPLARSPWRPSCSTRTRSASRGSATTPWGSRWGWRRRPPGSAVSGRLRRGPVAAVLRRRAVGRRLRRHLRDLRPRLRPRATGCIPCRWRSARAAPWSSPRSRTSPPSPCWSRSGSRPAWGRSTGSGSRPSTALLAWPHVDIARRGLDRVGMSFMTVNGAVGLLYGAVVVVATLWPASRAAVRARRAVRRIPRVVQCRAAGAPGIRSRGLVDAPVTITCTSEGDA